MIKWGLLFVLAISGFGQNKFVIKTTSLDWYVKNFDADRNALMIVADSLQVRIVSSSEGDYSYGSTGKSLQMSIWTEESGYTRLMQLFKSAGYIKAMNLSTVNNADYIQSQTIELEFLKGKKIKYEEEIDRLKQRSADEKYQVLWDELRNIEQQMFQIEKDILEKKQQTLNYAIELRMVEEVYVPFENRDQDVQFVNMPGLEYVYLKIENPTSSVSSSHYQGAMVKYLFTRGKSYAQFGVLKNFQSRDPSHPRRVDEIFFYSFGQDFYPRYLGRGAGEYFNLYTGYGVGGLFATGEKISKNIFFLMPNVGLELYKNRFVLLDSKLSYFIPFYKNRDLRGLALHASFNFVF